MDKRTQRASRQSVKGGEIMYHLGGSSAGVWRLKTVPPLAFNWVRTNLMEGGLDVQGGDVPACSQSLLCRRDEHPGSSSSVWTAPGHGTQDAQVLGAFGISTVTTAQSTEADVPALHQAPRRTAHPQRTQGQPHRQTHRGAGVRCRPGPSALVALQGDRAGDDV